MALGAGYRVGPFSRRIDEMKELSIDFEALRSSEFGLQTPVGADQGTISFLADLCRGQMQALLIAILILRDP